MREKNPIRPNERPNINIAIRFIKLIE
jgi:hypothetical protein